jgi:hypothetical protein
MRQRASHPLKQVDDGGELASIDCCLSFAGAIRNRSSVQRMLKNFEFGDQHKPQPVAGEFSTQTVAEFYPGRSNANLSRNILD